MWSIFLTEQLIYIWVIYNKFLVKNGHQNDMSNFKVEVRA